MQSAVSCLAYAKINLFLEITGRRADGYHTLASLMTFIALGDHVFVAVDSSSPVSEFSLETEGRYGLEIPGGADNLALTAAQIMAELAGQSVSVRIKLIKNLPPAAGLGGGSADAAAVMRSLALLWGMDINTRKMREAALRLGADVPFFLKGQAAYVSGIGECLLPVADLPPLGVLLVNPQQPLSTAAVFERYSCSHRAGFSASFPFPGDCDPGDPQQMVAVLSDRRNDLTAAASELMPSLRDILVMLSQLDGVLLTRMSGSGATCFALFADLETARQAAAQIYSYHSDLWVVATSLLSQTPPAKRASDSSKSQ